jgi:CO/xanthine dehydrogenase Mo-binding subunit
LAVIGACNKVIDELKVRAAKMWDVDPEGVDWEDGHAKPASKTARLRIISANASDNRC